MLERAESGSNERQLIDLVRCPSCAGEVAIVQERVVCKSGFHDFPIVDGVLVLIDDADLHRDPQYDRQRRYFDTEFARYTEYRPDAWRVSYLRRLRAGGVLGRADAPVIDVAVGGSGHTVIE